MMDCTLSAVDLSGQALTLEQVQTLCAYAGAHNPALTALTLADCALDARAMDALALMLRVHRRIERLDVSGNPEAGWQGACCLFRNLAVNPTLSDLRVARGTVGARGARELGQTLQCNGTLSYIDLSHSKLCLDGQEEDQSGVAELVQALRINGGLRTLKMAECGIRGAEVPAALAEALAWNRALLSLDLSRNALGEAGGKALAPLLSADNRLEELLVGNNALGDGGVLEIASHLPLNKTLVTLGATGNAASARARRILRRNWHERPAWKEKLVHRVAEPL
eukprot:g2145.t1